VDLEALLKGISGGINFLETLGGACALHASEIERYLPDERPDTIEELVGGCDVEALSAAFTSAMVAVDRMVEGSRGSEELFQPGIANLRGVGISLMKLENYKPESEVETHEFSIMVKGTRGDLKRFFEKFEESIEAMALDESITCAKAYGHAISVHGSIVNFSSQHQAVQLDLRLVNVADVLSKLEIADDPVAREEASTYAHGF
jgi:hypothetical protein